MKHEKPQVISATTVWNDSGEHDKVYSLQLVQDEPNGNGEVWTITRNNYRFIITATKDENFIDR